MKIYDKKYFFQWSMKKENIQEFFFKREYSTFEPQKESGTLINSRVGHPTQVQDRHLSPSPKFSLKNPNFFGI